MQLFRIRWRLVRFVLPMLTAIAFLVVLFTLTSWAANTIVWQPALTGLPNSGLIRDVAFGDFNNDGQPDLIAPAPTASSSIKGDGAGNWNGTGFSTGLPVAGQYGHVIVGDFNNDGKLDIAASQSSVGAVGRMDGQRRRHLDSVDGPAHRHV